MIQKRDNSFRVVASSIRGAGHEAKNAPCEDAHAYLQLPTGETVFSVCDGAGSKPLSAVGARIAAQTTVKTLASMSLAARISERFMNASLPLQSNLSRDQFVWENRLLEAFRSAREAVESEARRYQVEPSALASTLLAGVLFPDGYLAYGQLGDGRIITLDRIFHTAKSHPSPPLKARTEPYGEYANETIFLTSQGSLSKIEVACTKQPVGGVAVFTDGLGHIGFDLKNQTPRQGFLAPLFRIVAQGGPAATDEELGRFLYSGKIRKRTQDDVTLLIVAATPEVIPPCDASKASAPQLPCSKRG